MSDELKPYHFKENSIPSEFRDLTRNPDCFEAFSVKEVQRKLAGYEKREQNLKNKNKELAEQ